MIKNVFLLKAVNRMRHISLFMASSLSNNNDNDRNKRGVHDIMIKLMYFPIVDNAVTDW